MTGPTLHHLCWNLRLTAINHEGRQKAVLSARRSYGRRNQPGARHPLRRYTAVRRRGFHQVGVDGIGELARISGPAIYRHFGGKDEILAALFDAAIDRLLLLCGQLPHEPFDALQRLIEAHAEFAVTDRALLSVYAREERSLAEPWRRGLQRRQRQHIDRRLRVLGRCYPDRTSAEREAAAHAAIGMVHSVAGWPRSAREGLDLAPTLVSFVQRRPAHPRPLGRRVPGVRVGE